MSDTEPRYPTCCAIGESHDGVDSSAGHDVGVNPEENPDDGEEWHSVDTGRCFFLTKTASVIQGINSMLL